MHPILQNFRRGLIRLPRRRSYLRIEGLVAAKERFGVAELVLSRALCRFNRFDLSRLPANKRRAALSLQLPQWSPYPDSDYAVVWDGGVASVWCWDQDAVRQALQAAGGESSARLAGARKIPETLLRPPMVDGLRLVACLDGVEGQFWQSDQLVASRWWASAPQAPALLAFQRDCNLEPGQQMSSLHVQDCPMAVAPWAPIHGSAAQAGELSLPELALYAVLCLALGLPALALGIEQFQIGRAIDARRAEVAQMRARSQPLLLARDQAVAALTQIKAIRDLDRLPDPLALMVAVARALPEGGPFLKEWEMSEGRLRIVVSSPGADISGANYVSALEKSGRFADVKVLTQGDPKQMGFAMTILPWDAAEAGAASAGNAASSGR